MIAWNKGKKIQTNTGKTHFKKGEIGYWTGKKRSPETIEKMRVASTGRVAWNKGLKVDSNTGKTHFKKGFTPWNKGLKNHLSEDVVNKIRKSVIANLPKTFKDTKPELKVELELIRLNINYQKQVPLCKIAKVDFYLPEHRIVIQVDGCYWHNCPIHSKKILIGKTERDIQQDSILTFNGFNIYRIWEHDIMKKEFNLINFIKY